MSPTSTVPLRSTGTGSATWLERLTGFARPKGECVDADGDVYVTDRVAEDIVEYQHGATRPVVILSDTGFQDYACSVDPTTGNLAVANSYRVNGNAGGIAIYKNARGKPDVLRIDGIPNPQTCAYDTQGDMLVASDYKHDGEQVVSLGYMAKGRTTFIHLHLYVSGSQSDGVYNVQWDGKYWALLYDGNIVRFQITDDGRATYEGRRTSAATNNTSRDFGSRNYRQFREAGNPNRSSPDVQRALLEIPRRRQLDRLRLKTR